MSEEQDLPATVKSVVKSAADEQNDINASDTERAPILSKKGRVPRSKSHKINEPICLELRDCEHQCAPVHLMEYFQQFDLNNMSNENLLFQLVYLVAMEVGFAEQNCFENCLDKLNFDNYLITSYFNAWNVYCLSLMKPKFDFEITNTKFRMKLKSLILNAYTNVTTKNLNFILTGIVSGDFMILTMASLCNDKLDEEFSSQSVCLSIPRFIIGNATIRNNERPIQQSFRKINELTDILRETIFLPFQQYYLIKIGIDLFPSILGLPSELYDLIFHCLSPNQLRILANVNKQLNLLVVQSKHYKRKAPVLRCFNSHNNRSHSSSSSGSHFGILPPYF